MLKTLSFSTAAEVRTLRRNVLHIGRSTPHLGRKFYHFLNGIICVGLYAFALSREEALMLLGSVGGVFMLLDLIRLKSPALNAMTLKYFGRIMRREELRSVSGNSFYILGLLVLVYFFPKPIVLLSALYLAVGDPIAAVVGTHWGKVKITKRKTLEGALANWFSTSAISLLFGLVYLKLTLSQAVMLSVVGGSISTFVELLPSPIDDNFTIPVGSALLISAVSIFFPFLQ
ncbi:MAG: diacylglycerol/polyprenol kinase family protein [Pseudomonadota bacterium]